MHFRTFRGRLAFFILSLVAVVLGASFLIVLQANRRHAARQIADNLQAGSRIFATLTDRRLDELNEQARLLAYDYGFKQAFSSSADDRATMRLAMQNWRDRIRASFMVLVSLDKQVLYNSDQPARDGSAFDLPGLITAAEENAALEARGLMLREGKLYAVVVVPLLAPEPIAWICLGFRIDDAFATELAGLTKQSVSFVDQKNGPPPWTILASTFDDANAAAAARRAGAIRQNVGSDENRGRQKTFRDTLGTARCPKWKGGGRLAARLGSGAGAVSDARSGPSGGGARRAAPLDRGGERDREFAQSSGSASGSKCPARGRGRLFHGAK